MNKDFECKDDDKTEGIDEEGGRLMTINEFFAYMNEMIKMSEEEGHENLTEEEIDERAEEAIARYRLEHPEDYMETEDDDND